MRLLVTGASGFTGQHFVKSARAGGHEVIELQADLRNRDQLIPLVAQAAPEMVVHLAAISFVGHADVSAFYTVNVIGTLNLLDALAALPKRPQSILLASSANVYGNCDHSPISEEQPPMPVNHYGMSKLAMEYMARDYLDKLPLFFVRPFNYIGPGQADSFLIPKLITHFARKAESVELGNLEVEREFNDVRFVCEAYLRLLRTGKPGEVYNICTSNPVSPAAVIAALSQIAEHSIQVKINPTFVRTNEVHRLCGNPAKLIHAVGALPSPPLHETLRWMFEHSLETC